MKTFVINLVGKQTIPNILFIKEFFGFDEFVFITTQTMENQQKTAAICKVCRLEGGKIRKIKTEGELYNHIYADLSSEISIAQENIYVINLTGGTKMMALATYDYFKNYDNIEFYYTPIGTNKYYKLNDEKFIDFDYRLNVEEYLNAYGIEIITNQKKRNKLFTSKEETKRFLNNYINNFNLITRLIGSLRDNNSNIRQDKETKITHKQELNINELGIETARSGILNKYEARYLTGDWFEELIYSFIQEKLGLDNKSIYTGINIQNVKPDNELDVLFTWENKLHVIECKTSIYNSFDDENISNTTIYKLAALHSNFGLSAYSYIFTLSTRKENKQNVREIDINRAKVFSDIYFLTYEDIVDEKTTTLNEKNLEEKFLNKL